MLVWSFHTLAEAASVGEGTDHTCRAVQQKPSHTMMILKVYFDTLVCLLDLVIEKCIDS